MDPHTRPLVFSLVFLVVYGGLVYLALRWAKRFFDRRVQEVADGLAASGARIGAVRPAAGVWKPAVIDLTWEDRPATFSMRRYDRYWYLISLSVPSKPLPHVLLRAERSSDRLGKRMGFNREVQIGDPAFDAAAFIDTAEQDDVVRRLLERSDVRAAVLAVLASGFAVQMSPAGLEAIRLHRRLMPIDTSPLRTTLTALETLAPLLPTIEPTSFGRPHWFRSPRSMLLAFALGVVGISFTMAVATGVGVIHPLAVQSDIAHGFLVGLALYVASVAGLFLFQRGGTRSFPQFLLAAILMFVGVPFAGTMLAFVLNASLDTSPAVSHPARVLALGHTKKSNQVTFESWRPDHDKLVIGVPRARYNTLKVGDTVEVVTHAGALGWEWVESFH